MIAAGDQVKSKKPAPDVFNLALARLGVAPQHALALEDSRNGVLSAKRAGLPVLVTPSTYTESEDFAEADWVRPSLRSVDWPEPVQRALTP